MSKSKQIPAASKAAPSKASKAVFEINARVTLAMPDTPALTGTVINKTASGWHTVLLDDQTALQGDIRVKDGKISARAGSMVPLPPEQDDPDGSGEYFQAHREDLIEDTIDEHDPDEEADDDDEEARQTASSKMADALRRARPRYVKTKRPLGTASADNGDQIAKELREYEPDEVARLADVILKTPEGHHLAKYAHLNRGQIRMNSGNRIRAHYKNTVEATRSADATSADWNELERLNRLLNLIVDDEPVEQDDAGEAV